MNGIRPGSSIRLLSAGAAEVFITRTGDENCASLRLGLRRVPTPTKARPPIAANRYCFRFRMPDIRRSDWEIDSIGALRARTSRPISIDLKGKLETSTPPPSPDGRALVGGYRRAGSCIAIQLIADQGHVLAANVECDVAGKLDDWALTPIPVVHNRMIEQSASAGSDVKLSGGSARRGRDKRIESTRSGVE
jgi:hypothetical protein